MTDDDETDFLCDTCDVYLHPNCMYIYALIVAYVKIVLYMYM